MSLSTFLPVYIAQFARLLAPLLVLPIISGRLDIEMLSAVMSGQALAYVIMLGPEFGFATYGPRTIARHVGDRENRARAAGAIMAAKLCLCIPAALLGGLAAAGLPGLRADPALLLLTVALGLVLGMSPAWWFQGMGRAHHFAWLELLATALFVLTVVAADIGPRDGAFVLLAQVAPLLAAAVYGHVVLCRAGVGKPTAASVGSAIASSKSLFVLRLANNAPGLGLIYIAGLLLSPATAAFYMAAERLFMGSANLIWPVMQVMMPKIVQQNLEDRGDARRLFPLSAAVTTLIGFGLCALFLAASKPIVALVFGPGFDSAARILASFAIAMPFIAWSHAIAVGFLVARGHDNVVMAISTISAVVALIAGLIAAWFYGLEGLVAVRVGVEIGTATLMTYAFHRFRRAPIWRQPVAAERTAKEPGGP